MILRVRVCIPTFDNPQSIGDVIADTLDLIHLPILIVDDGSLEPVAKVIERHPRYDQILAALSEGRLEILRIDVNAGKGRAIQAAIRVSVEAGFTHLCTMDGDGQHYPREIDKLVSLAKKHPWSLIIGARKFHGEHIPGSSKFGRKFSNFWVAYQTGLAISDSQSGFRLYPLFQLQNIKFFTKRYDFEIEVLIRAIWKGLAIREVEIDVFYPDPSVRVSHFNKLWDNVRISILNTIFVILTLLKDRRSPARMAVSVGMGVFIGATPLYGLHTVLVALASVVFRLNFAAALVGSQISLPPFAPILILASLWIGRLILGAGASKLVVWGLGSVVLGVGLAVTIGSFFYLFLKFPTHKKKSENWNGRSRGGTFGNAFLHAILKSFGPKAGYFCLRFVVPYFYLFAPRGRRALNEYYHVTQPSLSWAKRQAKVVEHFYRFGQVLMDQGVQRYSSKPQFKSQQNGIENITAAISAGNGVILLSAHIGSWNLAADLLPTKMSMDRLTVIEYSPDKMQFSSGEKLVQVAQSEPRQSETLDHTRLAPNQSDQPIFNINQLLRDGRPIGLMGDRPLGSRFELVQFFDRLAPIDVTPFRIAAITGAPLIFTWGFKLKDQTYSFYASQPKRLVYDSKINREIQLQIWAQDYASELAQILKQYPEQWFNFFPFWSAVPVAPSGVRSGRTPNYLREELREQTRLANQAAPGQKSSV
jgi:predicted LPLAT superfamily acyltransferase/glycosyltransferase involved in cell wall biosynthesis